MKLAGSMLLRQGLKSTSSVGQLWLTSGTCYSKPLTSPVAEGEHHSERFNARRYTSCTNARTDLCLLRLGQLGHRKLRVPAVVCYVAVQNAGFGVLETVAAHLGVLVVDGVEENKDGRDYENRCGHKAGYEGQIVLWDERDEKRTVNVNSTDEN